MQNDMRDKLVKLIRQGKKEFTKSDVTYIETYLADYLIANGVGPVVRCKDCKHCIDEGMGGLWCNHADNRNPIGCRPDDYCNDGERKEQ